LKSDKEGGTLVEVAASLFLSLVLFSAIRVLSLFGAPLALFAAAPMAVLCIRRGESTFLMAAMAGAVLSGLLMGGASAMAYALTVAFPAVLIARGLAYDWRPEKIVGIATVVIAGVSVLMLRAMLPEGVRPWIDQLVAESISSYQANGAPPAIVAMMQKQAENYANVMYHVIPMAFAWSGMALTVASMLATRGYFSRTPHPAVTLSPITRWSLPDSWVWVLIGAAVLALLPSGPMRAVGGNLLGVLALAYACQGWAVMAHQFEARDVHPGLRAAVYLTLLLWPIFVLLLVAVGVFDVWTDVRKVRDDAATEGDAGLGDGPVDDDPEQHSSDEDDSGPDDSAPRA
jgi:uncharacterized protein YybS (DUF2232 family)